MHTHYEQQVMSSPFSTEDRAEALLIKIKHACGSELPLPDLIFKSSLLTQDAKGYNYFKPLMTELIDCLDMGLVAAKSSLLYLTDKDMYETDADELHYMDEGKLGLKLQTFQVLLAHVFCRDTAILIFTKVLESYVGLSVNMGSDMVVHLAIVPWESPKPLKIYGKVPNRGKRIVPPPNPVPSDELKSVWDKPNNTHLLLTLRSLWITFFVADPTLDRALISDGRFRDSLLDMIHIDMNKIDEWNAQDPPLTFEEKSELLQSHILDTQFEPQPDTPYAQTLRELGDQRSAIPQDAFNLQQRPDSMVKDQDGWPWTFV